MQRSKVLQTAGNEAAGTGKPTSRLTLLRSRSCPSFTPWTSALTISEMAFTLACSADRLVRTVHISFLSCEPTRRASEDSPGEQTYLRLYCKSILSDPHMQAAYKSITCSGGSTATPLRLSCFAFLGTSSGIAIAPTDQGRSDEVSPTYLPKTVPATIAQAAAMYWDAASTRKFASVTAPHTAELLRSEAAEAEATCGLSEASGVSERGQILLMINTSARMLVGVQSSRNFYSLHAGPCSLPTEASLSRILPLRRHNRQRMSDVVVCNAALDRKNKTAKEQVPLLLTPFA